MSHSAPLQLGYITTTPFYPKATKHDTLEQDKADHVMIVAMRL
ncbi:hypothetical protein PCIT_a2474 [Pseudoalteromonas citrea]|uniref:Uncharacterized protein n=1 Tax=Pseudoalteromonas citrea TaxID=43655 RepID=A0AAD4AJW3_9GAMM|nr:hypothetical protein PCIT_a2474 [Pseudoalteromonas citrea]